MTTTGQPSRWEAFVSNFKQSNYITDFWNWFMTLMSKAAEMVLFGTVLYSGYQLLPGVPHVPAAIDAAVFVIQQGALDIGGMGLLKLAKRAKLPRDSFPVRIGVSLVVLMIVNVALASFKHTLPMIPDGVYVGIETLLLIARAIMAVLFGHAIHALREEYGDSAITIKEASELQERIEALTTELAQARQDLQQQVREIHASVSPLVRSVVQSHAHSVMSELQAVEARFEAQMKQQHIALTEAVCALQSEARTTPHEATQPASSRKTEATVKLLSLKQRTAAPNKKRAAVYALLESNQSLSSYEIAEQTGYPPSTIQRYMRDWKTRQSEATDTAS